MTSRAKWLLFFAFILFPFALTTVTYEVGAMRTRQVDFCASCHVMTPFVEGVRDPKSDMLAALHFQNRWIPHQQCYTCHVDYGMFGELDAKVRSVRHAAAFYLKKDLGRPKLYKPYPSRNCLHCHQGARSFEEQPAHEDVKDALKSGSASCLDCHGPAHPGGEG